MSSFVRLLEVGLKIRTDQESAAKAESSLDKITSLAKKAVAVFAAFKAADIFTGIATQTAALGDSIDKTSQRLGVGTQALQELQFAANLAGASNENLSVGLRQLTKNAFEAGRGSKTMQENFARLGVNIRDASGNLKSADQILQESADGMAALSTDTERAAIAQSLMGEGGAALVPLLKQGSAAIAEQRREAQSLGGVLADDLVAISVEFTDEQTKLGQTMQFVRNVIARNLLPIMIRISESFRAFIVANQELISTGLGVFLNIVGGALSGIFQAFARIGAVIGRAFSGLSPVAKTILKITALVLGLLAVLFLPFAPILLIGAAIGLVLDDFFAWQDGADSVIGRVIGWVNDLIDRFPILRSVINFVKDVFDLAFEGMMITIRQITAAFEFLASKAQAVFGFVAGAAKKVARFVGISPTQAEAGAAPTGFIAGGTQAVGSISPQASLAAGGSGGRTVNAPMSNSIVINATGSAADDPELLASKMEEVIRRAGENERRQVSQAFALEPG